jgi:hypothetical protein
MDENSRGAHETVLSRTAHMSDFVGTMWHRCLSLRPDSQCSGAVGRGWVITEIGLSTKLSALAGENVWLAFGDAFVSN